MAITFCISTHNNLEYLKLAIQSVRKNSYYYDAPFIVHAENCSDGTNVWLEQNKYEYDLTLIIEPDNEVVRGIGGGMNICAENVKTEYIMFLHSDFYVSKNWDLELLKEIEKYSEPTWTFSYRFQPNIFNEESRVGTYIVDKDDYGCYWNDFNAEKFEMDAIRFSSENDIRFNKAEGVSGLISKKNWDFIGGNDPVFSPASYEDMDLFLRMKTAGYRFILTTKSVVWHFGARGSHRLEENGGKSSMRQMESEQKNYKKWLEKWGRPPHFDENGMIIGLK